GMQRERERGCGLELRQYLLHGRRQRRTESIVERKPQHTRFLRARMAQRASEHRMYAQLVVRETMIDWPERSDAIEIDAQTSRGLLHAARCGLRKTPQPAPDAGCRPLFEQHFGAAQQD